MRERERDEKKIDDIYLSFHGAKTTDPLSSSATFPHLLGWSSVSEKSAEVVAPEK